MGQQEPCAEQARKNVNDFIEYCIRDCNNNPLTQAPFHREWQQLMDDYESVAIISPAAFGSSVQLAGRVIFELGHNRNLRIKIVSASDSEGSNLLHYIRDLIVNEPRVKEVFQDLVIDHAAPDNSEEFTVVRPNVGRSASVTSAGVFASGAGGRVDRLILDNVCTTQNSIVNPAQRPKVIIALRSLWMALLSDTGRVIMVNRNVHPEDAVHVLGAEFEGQWAEPALNKFGRPLWPAVWSKEKLAQRKKIIGPKAFNHQFMLEDQAD